jgi:hypothetical protein
MLVVAQLFSLNWISLRRHTIAGFLLLPWISCDCRLKAGHPLTNLCTISLQFSSVVFAKPNTCMLCTHAQTDIRICQQLSRKIGRQPTHPFAWEATLIIINNLTDRLPYTVGMHAYTYIWLASVLYMSLVKTGETLVLRAAGRHGILPGLLGRERSGCPWWLSRADLAWAFLDLPICTRPPAHVFRLFWSFNIRAGTFVTGLRE